MAAALVLAGCSSGGMSADEARETWESVAPASYTYRLESTCGDQALLGLFLVTVEDGVVVRVDGLDAAGQLSASIPSVAAEAPSIEGLLERIAADGEAVTDVAFEAETGMPTTVTFDAGTEAEADDECYSLEDVDVLPTVEDE